MWDRVKSLFRRGPRRNGGSAKPRRGGTVVFYPMHTISGIALKSPPDADQRRKSFRKRSQSSASVGSGYSSDSVLSRRRRHRKPVIWESTSSLPQTQGLPVNVLEYETPAAVCKKCDECGSESSLSTIQSTITILSLRQEQAVVSREARELAAASIGNPAHVNMKVCNDFEAHCPGEISCELGQHVTGLFRKNNWIYVRARNGVEGYVPYQYCRLNRQGCPRKSGITPSVDSASSSKRGRGNSSANTTASKYACKVGLLSPCHSETDVFQAPCSPTERKPNRQQPTIASNAGESSILHHAGKSSSLSHLTSYSKTESEYQNIECWRKSTSRAGNITVSDSEMTQGKSVQAAFEPQLRKQAFEPQLRKQAPEPPARPLYLSRCITVRSHCASRGSEISTSLGDTSFVMNADDEHWLWVCRKDGSAGYVPRKCVVIEDVKKHGHASDEFRPAAQGSDTELQLALRENRRRNSSESCPQPTSDVTMYAQHQPTSKGTSTSNIERESSKKADSSSHSPPGCHLSSKSLPFKEQPVDVPQDLLTGKIGAKRVQPIRTWGKKANRVRRMSSSGRRRTVSVGDLSTSNSVSEDMSLAIITRGYAACKSSDITVGRDQIVKVLSSSTENGNKAWMKIRDAKGNIGFIPSACAGPLPPNFV